MRTGFDREDSAVSVRYDKVLGGENRCLALILSYPLGSLLLSYRGASVAFLSFFRIGPAIEKLFSIENIDY